MRRGQLNRFKSNIRVNVLVNTVSAERFWDFKRPIPPVKIATNLNLIDIQKSQTDFLEVPFVFTISYNPAVAQISVKGKAHVLSDEKKALEKIYMDYRDKKPPPPLIVQTISNIVFLESVLISRTLNIPPPIPLPKISLTDVKRSKIEPSYRA